MKHAILPSVQEDLEKKDCLVVTNHYTSAIMCGTNNHKNNYV